MPLYKYTAQDQEGSNIQGFLDAENEFMASNNLKSKNYQVINIQTAYPLKIFLLNHWQKLSRIKREQIILFINQLATMLKAGIPIGLALKSIIEQTKNLCLKKVLVDIHYKVEGGSLLSEAMSLYPSLFPNTYTGMIKVGESGGILETVLSRIADLSTKELEIRSQIKSALLYPIIIVFMAIIVLIALVFVIIPKFMIVFKAYETQIPFSTKVLLLVSAFLKKGWLGILIFFFLWERSFF
ncbi:MAG: type II secretion system F family protein [bacterium]